jgi:hypothetical protein
MQWWECVEVRCVLAIISSQDANWNAARVKWLSKSGDDTSRPLINISLTSGRDGHWKAALIPGRL